MESYSCKVFDIKTKLQNYPQLMTKSLRTFKVQNIKFVNHYHHQIQCRACMSLNKGLSHVKTII